MGRVLCMLRRHQWGPVQLDARRPYRICERCGKFEGSGKNGPDGYDGVPPQVIGGSSW